MSNPQDDVYHPLKMSFFPLIYGIPNPISHTLCSSFPCCIGQYSWFTKTHSIFGKLQSQTTLMNMRLFTVDYGQFLEFPCH